jgi:hypothetical protein
MVSGMVVGSCQVLKLRVIGKVLEPDGHVVSYTRALDRLRPVGFEKEEDCGAARVAKVSRSP